MAELSVKDSKNFSKILPRHQLMEKLLTSLPATRVHKSIQTDCYPRCCRNKVHIKQQPQHEKFVDLMLNLREKIDNSPKFGKNSNNNRSDDEWATETDGNFGEKFVKFPKETHSAMQILLQKRRYSKF